MRVHGMTNSNYILHGEDKDITSTITPPAIWPKNFVKRMLRPDLFAIANLVVSVYRATIMQKVKGKVNVHTLDIAPLRSESPPQKRSGVARVLKGFHSFTCTPTRSSAIGMSHTCHSHLETTLC